MHQEQIGSHITRGNKGKQDFVPKEKMMHVLLCAKEFTKRGSAPILLR